MKPNLRTKIKDLITQVDNRNDFYNAVADNFKVSATTVKHNWHHGAGVPKKHQVRFIIFTRGYIDNQNEDSDTQTQMPKSA
ncbi:hypothetical protein ACFSTE_09495 [Aquimarina hainanensis]|uniref:Uncharacterized protein n=1 Tax=Aquimarina hainanensis TaxID=1578017 RepID=A0ABW5N7X9_9FLAO